MTRNYTERQIDFIGIGASKSGTNWIRTCLQEHSQIYTPLVTALKYFDSQRYEPELREFWKAFENVNNESVVGEFTPRYYHSKVAIDRLYKHFPNIKIIASLRDPVARAISQYKYNVLQHGREMQPEFKKAIVGKNAWQYIDKSLYHKHLLYVFERFPVKNIHLILFEEIRENPDRVLEELYQFLGVETDFTGHSESIEMNPTPIVNKRFASTPEVRRLRKKLTVRTLGAYLKTLAKLRKLQFKQLIKGKTKKRKLEGLVITDQDRKMLYRDHFKKDIERLEELTSMNLSMWKDPYK